MNIKYALMTVKVLALCLFGCGASQSLTSSEALRAQYPDAQYIVGVGRIPAIAGGAQSNANRINVQNAADDSIWRTLNTETKSVLTAARSSINRQLNSRYEYKITSEAKSDPAVFPLIKTAPNSLKCSGKECTIVRILPRKALFDHYNKVYRPMAETFRSAVGDALSATKSASKFAHHHRTAEDAYKPLMAVGAKLEAVGAGDASVVQQDRNRFIKLLQTRDTVLSSIQVSVGEFDRLSVTVQGSVITNYSWSKGKIQDPALARKARGALSSAMSSLGIKSTTGNRCSDGFMLKPSGELICKAVSGLDCLMRMSGTLIRCADNAAISEFEIAPDRLLGSNGEYNVVAARREVLQALKAEAIAKSLRDALKRHLPLR